ncbi:N-acetyl-gamma-glutamyl-phosphate reductase [Telmatocola sphagniphila]|uniref:N-acetyl-gamma-glutamyl-phosphate reductase n=1 Tax=Telmatocola sphagniphila TaxID=1123043 RepID=A0A8E6B4W7_9BACT|nr:N-acetyl-gamma-glutamyl-phosphate reductase [Telmatocola sphagniphila]QVL32190.1 N-acetyl-gamma-glutamyl-phosphate reductase [Telmatocola sphagniphila]
MTKVAILGGSGYTALELMKIFLRHPEVQIEAITSRDKEFPHIADVHPSLAKRLDIRCEVFDARKLKDRGVDCVFGCLPHGASAESIKQILPLGMRVVDLSADYRLRSTAEFQKYYGEPHHDIANLADAVYGFPEVYGDKITAAKLIANPGCYPQTGIIGLLPLVAAKEVDLKNIIIDSKSGVSGAGRTPKLNTHFPECNENFSAYNVGKHRHTPEIEQTLGDVAGETVEVIFTPHLVPMDRGMLSTIYAVPKRSFTEPELYEMYRAYYASNPFVRIREALPTTKDVTFSNYLDIALRVVRGKIVILVCIDNLVRGASGVAVQNFNRMFGYVETTALI